MKGTVSSFSLPVQQMDHSEGSCLQFQSQSSDCQLFLTNFDIIHRLDLGKSVSLMPETDFVSVRHITFVGVQLHLGWLKRRDMCYKTQTAGSVKDMKLTQVIH